MQNEEKNFAENFQFSTRVEQCFVAFSREETEGKVTLNASLHIHTQPFLTFLFLQKSSPKNEQQQKAEELKGSRIRIVHSF